MKLLATLLLLFVSTTVSAVEHLILTVDLQENHRSEVYLKNPNILGISTIYYWSQLEKGKDVYDFSAINKDLKIAKKYNKKLFVMVRDKAFVSSVMPVPAYLQKYTRVYIRKNKKETVIQRWNPEVGLRFRKLITALGKAYNGNETFLGMKTSETAIMAGLTRISKSDRMNYAKESVQTIRAMAHSFPDKMTIFYMNWFPGGTQALMTLAHEAALNHVGLGGPDVQPDNVKMQSYPVLRAYKNKLTVMMDVQWDNYRHTQIDGDVEELYRFAVHDLGAKYLVWLLKPGYKEKVLTLINQKKKKQNDSLKR